MGQVLFSVYRKAGRGLYQCACAGGATPSRWRLSWICRARGPQRSRFSSFTVSARGIGIRVNLSKRYFQDLLVSVGSDSTNANL
ncbi:hypothetical protein LSH36_168g03029 [Paralvinella palmiformis]|uniref:Uncharacterized protein n=1 Tax=Paralvinella palmiformis TaxID=53620 RepID=A0AAD9N6E6_9ANNE|nr:hypothetical protein LSH36_168g03029 [Paralvinella palmiformis]